MVLLRNISDISKVKNNTLKLKRLLICIATLFLGCYLPNDPPKNKFGFGFKGRLERLEEAFYSSKLNYVERDFSQYLQISPEYEFVIIHSDTTINYVVTLSDCQSIYSLVKWNDNWKCDSSFIIVRNFSSNIDSLPDAEAEKIFKNEIIVPLSKQLDSVKNNYRWVIEKKQDTVFVKIVNQNDSLRKLYIYSFDSVGNDIAEKEIINYLGDSTIIYYNSPQQRYIYIKSKKVIHK